VQSGRRQRFPFAFLIMAPDALTFDDPRVERLSAVIRGKTYGYILGKPEGTPAGTVFLAHGFPDLGWGWRNQIPLFLSMGFRVIAPDMLGYGRTDAPQDLESYSHKSISDDIAALTAHVIGPEEKIILGGHDWGGILVWKTALWYPDLIKAVFSICSPFLKPSAKFFELKDIIAAGHLKQFSYQLQFAGPEVEGTIQGQEKIRQFLNAMYGATSPDKERGFSAEKGVLFDNLPKLGPSPLVAKEVVDTYTREYLRSGMHGPLNWYRTRKINFEEELPLVEKEQKGELRFKMPALLVTALKDSVLLPSLSAGMESSFDNLTRGEVDTNHWAQWQAPEDVNQIIKDWIEGVVLKGTDAIKAAL
jgi:soluble epoxide hydrolase / lipid-phosphate phosphatase